MLAVQSEETGAVRRGGRPSERDEAKRAAVAVRTTPTIKAMLKAAADARGRSITQEIEQRLERSFDDERLLGGSASASLLRRLLSLIEDAETEAGAAWHESYVAYHAVRRSLLEGIPQLMALRRPPMPNEPAILEAERERSKIEQDLQSVEDDLRTAGVMPPARSVSGQNLLLSAIGGLKFDDDEHRQLWERRSALLRQLSAAEAAIDETITGAVRAQREGVAAAERAIESGRFATFVGSPE